MERRPGLSIHRLMIGIAVLAVLLGSWRVDPAFTFILVAYGVLFLPMLRSAPLRKQ